MTRSLPSLNLNLNLTLLTNLPLPKVKAFRLQSATTKLNLSSLSIHYHSSPSALYTFENDLYSERQRPAQRAQILDRYTLRELREQNGQSRGFRWQVVTNTSKKQVPLGVQREWLRRRWSACFRESLRCVGGMDQWGRLLNSAMNDLKGQGGSRAGLTGTFEIIVYNGRGVDQTPEELREVTDGIVKGLCEKFGV